MSLHDAFINDGTLKTKFKSVIGGSYPHGDHAVELSKASYMPWCLKPQREALCGAGSDIKCKIKGALASYQLHFLYDFVWSEIALIFSYLEMEALIQTVSGCVYLSNNFGRNYDITFYHFYKMKTATFY